MLQCTACVGGHCVPSAHTTESGADRPWPNKPSSSQGRPPTQVRSLCLEAGGGACLLYTSPSPRD
eukprot:14888632-Alexandrium_andersonii.AAC.2